MVLRGFGRGRGLGFLGVVNSWWGGGVVVSVCLLVGGRWSVTPEVRRHCRKFRNVKGILVLVELVLAIHRAVNRRDHLVIGILSRQGWNRFTQSIPRHCFQDGSSGIETGALQERF